MPGNARSATITYAPEWFIPVNNIHTSPDLFSPCALTATMHAPLNTVGFQYAHSGSNYAGLIAYFDEEPPPGYEMHEYMCTRLICPLVSGRRYYAGFYTSLADFSKDASCSIAMKFLPSLPTSDFYTDPDLGFNTTNSVLADTADWVLFADTIVATGEEKYVIIGSFVEHDSTYFEPLYPSNPITRAYYYIDDVFVIPVDTQYYDPGLDFLGTDKYFCPQDTYTYNLADSLTDIVWQDSIASPSYTITGAGLYNVSLCYSGFRYQDSVHVFWESLDAPVCNTSVIMPNVFTPNGDGENDFFVPASENLVSNASLTILNRWGNQVFVTDDIFSGWDGEIDGAAATDGIYY